LITGVLFYFYIHEFKDELTKGRTITYFILGAYFIFSGFFGLKMILSEPFSIKSFDIYNTLHIFALMHLLSNIGFTIFITNSIKYEKNVINDNKNKSSV
jgi:hypothetical protein